MSKKYYKFALLAYMQAVLYILKAQRMIKQIWKCQKKALTLMITNIYVCYQYLNGETPSFRST